MNENGELGGPRPRNPVIEAVLGFLLSLLVLPLELLVLILLASVMPDQVSVFAVFLAVGVIFFGLCFWVVKRKRRSMLPGLIIGAAFFMLLTSFCYQLSNFSA